MSNTSTHFTASVTPTFVGLVPSYDVLVYVVRIAGICGPAETGTAATLAEVDEMLTSWGYTRIDEFGAVCANGFASAPIVRYPS